jgi:hypothetical protein
LASSKILFAGFGAVQRPLEEMRRNPDELRYVNGNDPAQFGILPIPTANPRGSCGGDGAAGGNSAREHA